MDAGNQTQVTEFVLLGFSGIRNGQAYLFIVFLLIYLVTMLGNMLIVILIQVDSHLHSPMYFFLSHLSFMDIGTSSTTVPKILANLLHHRHTISYRQCLAQMYFLIAFSGSECWLLAIMAYDRYAAICQPLHYAHLMRTRVCTLLAMAVWVWGFLDPAIHAALATNLHFCGVNQIHHIFCDIPPLLKIACGDKHVNEITLHIASFFAATCPLLIILLSYFYILAAILKLRSITGRRKAFSTCASHLIVVLIYFGNGLLNYNQPRAGYSLEISTLISTLYGIITPMLNPMIYSFRNKDVKGALKKVLESQRKVYSGTIS